MPRQPAPAATVATRRCKHCTWQTTRVFLEFAAALGKRIEGAELATDEERIAYAFQLCFARKPSKLEAERLLKYVQSQPDTKTAWTQTARVLMNLDEFITRE